MDNWIYSCELLVRDSDIDFQMIVANHWYQAYMGHANNLMIRAMGYDIHELHDEGYDCVMVRVEIDFKQPLVLGDRIRIDCDLQFKGSFQTIFVNQIVRLSDGAIVANGKWFGCVIGKKEEGPVEPSGLRESRANYLALRSQ